MTEWREWSDADAAARWNDELVGHDDYSAYQAWGWGEYKRRTGSAVIRGTLAVDGLAAGMAQCLVREYPALRGVAIWVPGGPVGRLAARVGLAEALQRRYPRRAIFVRVNAVAPRSDESEAAWHAAGWVPARFRVGHPLTFQLDLDGPEPLWRERLHGNWRHNLKRGQQRGVTVETWPETAPLDPIHAVCRETAEQKRLASTLTLGALTALRQAFDKDLTLVVGRDDTGRVLAVRGFVRVGSRAYDVIAAMSAEGRRSYASYTVMWRLLELARAQGVRLYDLSGADAERAAGVYNFKAGLGGTPVALLGEWEWATHPLLRRAVDVVLRLRGVVDGAGA